MKYFLYYDSPIGRIALVEERGSITNLFFESDTLPENIEKRETPVLLEAGKQLTEYFSGQRISFDLPLAPLGTDFMMSVWRQLSKIPYGETVSYKAIARAIGNEKACRAVGNVNNKNPIPLIIPCHRVIGSNNRLVGYRGGLEAKTYLLQLEKRVIDS